MRHPWQFPASVTRLLALCMGMWAASMPAAGATPTLTLSPSNPTLINGLTADFKASFGPNNEDKTSSVKSWTSSDLGVAVIDQSGHAVALAPGVTTISAAFGKLKGSTTLTVITVSNPIFSTQPSMTPVGAAITPAIKVLIQDNRSLPVAGLSVTMSIGTNGGQGGSGTLGGTLSHSTDTAGIATFANLRLDWLGTGYTLVATVATPTGPLSSTSTPFDLTRTDDGPCLAPTPACSSFCGDNDGDGLNDAWEMAGGIDLNGDGEITDAQHDFLLAGADPNTPDIYVLYDWMDYGLAVNTCVTDLHCTSRGRYHAGEQCGGLESPHVGLCTYACTTDSDCTSRTPATAAHAGERCVNNVCEHTHDPLVLEANSFQPVIGRFAAHGINLHISRGEARPHSQVVSWRDHAQMTIGCEGAAGANVGVGKYAVSFYALKPPQASPLAYHYALFGHTSNCDSAAHCSACPTPNLVYGQAGIAELSGNDFIVSLGGVINDTGTSPHFQIPSTFMHELGHNLGIRHDGHLDSVCDPLNGDTDCGPNETCAEHSDGQGPACHEIVGGIPGAEEPNYKPNYLSIMNYRYQRAGIPIGAAVGARTQRRCSADSDCGGNGAFCLPGVLGALPSCSLTGYVCQADADCTLPGEACLPPSPGYCARLDYSSQTLPIGGATPGALDESNLDDTVGLGSGTADMFTYTDGLCHTSWRLAPATGPVNWGGDGVFMDGTGNLHHLGDEVFTNTSVQADIDAENFTLCSSAPTDVLHGHTDWPDLSGIPFNYRFQCTPNGQK